MPEVPDPYSEGRIIPLKHLADVCKYRQGEQCCRYVYFPSHKSDHYCVKKISEMKAYIDSISQDFKAQGDNCPGLSDEDVQCDE